MRTKPVATTRKPATDAPMSEEDVYKARYTRLVRRKGYALFNLLLQQIKAKADSMDRCYDGRDTAACGRLIDLLQDAADKLEEAEQVIDGTDDE